MSQTIISFQHSRCCLSNQKKKQQLFINTCKMSHLDGTEQQIQRTQKTSFLYTQITKHSQSLSVELVTIRDADCLDEVT